MEELKTQVSRLQQEVDEAVRKAGLDKLEEQHRKILKDISAPDFWQKNPHAQEVAREEGALVQRIKPWRELLDAVKELSDLAEMEDQSLLADLAKQVPELNQRLGELKKELRFSGPYDDHGVILSIHAGAGGTDAQDWAQMLMRMYLRWAESQKVKATIIDQSAGEEAGIKSVDIELTGGNFLYGRLSGEHGVHRLVRLSPFNADHLRQTSFAKVEILPLIDKPSEVDMDEKDLKIDVFRAGGHGGQSVNTTDSAVRVTHLPSGISVAIQNERSQLQNKEKALAILRSKLVQQQLEQHADDLSQLKGPNQSAEWGNQIRSYVLHPYKQVKDLRTGYESSDVESVLNGKLEPLIEAWLEEAPNR